MSSTVMHRWRHRLAICTMIAGLPFFSAGSADADLVISSAPNQNVHCSASKCSATAANAVLNANRLENMLAAGNVAVSTAQTAGPNIVVNASLTWVSANSLTLDAYTSVVVNAPLTVAGPGGLSIITNDGGFHGTLAVADGANVVFWGTSNKLAVNRIRYTLVNSIASLAAAVNAHPAGFFALSKSYDASMDGTYAAAPVRLLQGTFEGFGNTISNLSIKAPKGEIGLIEGSDLHSLIENLKLTNVNISSQKPASAGGLLGLSMGTVSNVSVSGKVTISGKGAAGLIAGTSFFGEISNSHSSGTVKGRLAGGLLGVADADAGYGGTSILNSSSTASIASPAKQIYAAVGGLVGYTVGLAIGNSWASGTVTGGPQAWAGGLTGNLDCGVILASFATGAVSGGDNASVGGLTGLSGNAGGPCGAIFGSYASGSVQGGANSYDGGIVGSCGTPLVNDFATGSVSGGLGGYVGGLVGWSLCSGMDQVSASGNVAGGSATGGLVGYNVNSISNAYATGTVIGTTGGDVGGLIGQNLEPVSSSYAAGVVTDNGAKYVGGLIGEDQTQYKYLSHTYWDMTTSAITNPAQGTGSVSSDPGVTGRSDRQLKDGLPNGFSSTVWGQSPQINGGLPYLLANTSANAARVMRLKCPARLPPKFAALCWSRLKP